MDIINKLETLIQYYSSTRGVGHTRSMLEGALHTDCLVVTPNLGISKTFSDKGLKCVALNNLEYGSLRGCKKPIVFDNSSILEICSDSLHHIAELKIKHKKELEISKSLVRDETDKNHQLTKENEDLKERLIAAENDIKMYEEVIMKMVMEIYN